MAIQVVETAAGRLSEFLEFMWGGLKGYVYLATKDQTNDWSKRSFEWPQYKSAVVNFVMTKSAAGMDVYFCPSVFSAKRPIKENFKAAQVLWVDYDGTALEAWGEVGETLDRSQEGTGSDLTAYPPVPSLRVQSSIPSRQHAYWRLKEPSQDIDFIEAANRQMAYITGGDISGWDATQVLRPIETTNYKHDKPVTVFDENRNEYTHDQFSHYKPLKQTLSLQIDDSNLPKPEEILAKYTWPEQDIQLILKSGQEVPDGMRARALMRVGHSCAEIGLGDAEIYVILLYCDDKWEKYKGRNDRKRRLVDIVLRAKRAHPHAIDNLTFAGLLNPDTPVESNLKDVYGFNDLLAVDIKIEWMIKDLIAKGGLGLITAQPNAGKTQILLNFAMKCALGVPFLDWSPLFKHKTMFASFEMNLPSIKHFLEAMGNAYTPEEKEMLNQNFLIAPVGMDVDFTSPQGQKYMETLIEQYQPSGLYIDSLQKIYPHDLNRDDMVRKLFQYITYLRNKYGIYITLIHHDRKAQDSNKKPRELADVYGSVFITAEPDWVMNLWKPSPEAQTLELRMLKNRLSPVMPTIKIERVEHLQFKKLDGEGSFDGLVNNPTPGQVPGHNGPKFGL